MSVMVDLRQRQRVRAVIIGRKNHTYTRTRTATRRPGDGVGYNRYVLSDTGIGTSRTVEETD